MPRPGEKDTGGNVWSGTPYQSAPTHTGSIQGVWVPPGQKVEWIWSADGTYIIGYNLVNEKAEESS